MSSCAVPTCSRCSTRSSISTTKPMSGPRSLRQDGCGQRGPEGLYRRVLCQAVRCPPAAGARHAHLSPPRNRCLDRDHYAEMDAANVDLKGFTDEFYVKLCGAHLQPVLDTLIYLHHETDV